MNKIGSPDIEHSWRRLGGGLSARLLLLTILFVMLSEVLIYVPSIARFRNDYLENRIAKAHLAILALEATPDNMVGRELEATLLFHAGAYGINLVEPERRVLMLGEEPPPPVDLAVDLRDETVVRQIGRAFTALLQTGNRVLKVTDRSPGEAEASIEVIFDEAPLRDAMQAFSTRILTLSIIISLFTAGLVFLALQWLMVRPIVHLTEAMMRFRERPEDDTASIQPSDRRDEIGVAQRELAAMQADLRTALHQKSRLAALGAAVAKINHDLRNALSSAVLASDRLSGIADPEVQRVAPKLYHAIDRAVALCTQTLGFVRDVRPALHVAPFTLAEVVGEVEADLFEDARATLAVRRQGCELVIDADRDHFARVLSNLALNAAQAGARTLTIDARLEGTGAENGRAIIEIGDDGPGIPLKLHGRLFEPFSGSGRDGGSGLGLAIAREIVRAHAGELSLAATGPAGTIFRIELPRAWRGQARAALDASAR